jgi:uncharacterized protein (UPF0276 family)
MSGDLTGPGQVGVGIVYNRALAAWLAAAPGALDAVSLIPETLWHQSTEHPRYRWIPAAVEPFERAQTSIPIVFHGIGLSIGSGLPLDGAHLDQVEAAADRYQPLWYSEHLSAFKVDHGPGEAATAGVGLPVPLDMPTLRQLVPKVAEVVSRLGLDVLLENSAIYVEVPGAEMSEAEFLNRLCDASGAGILLDLHNLMVNEVNLGWSGERFLDELDLSRVGEIHVAGGAMLGRWYSDAHSGACPERVYELLDAVLPRAPALRLVTFELHESRVEQLGLAGVEAELARIRSAVNAAPSRVP